MRKQTRSRRVSSSGRGAGGAGPAAAGIVGMPPVLTEAYAALSAGNISWREFAAVSEGRSKSSRPYRRSKSSRPYTRRDIRSATAETRRWRR